MFYASHLKSFLSLLGAVLIGMHASFFNTGTYTFILGANNTICSCNHNSKNEIHSTVNPISIKSKSTCHITKPGEKHICHCKKQGASTKYLSQLSSLIYILFPLDDISPKLQISFPVIGLLMSLLDGFQLKLIKPPRI